MKKGLLLLSAISIGLLIGSICFADIVHFNNGFIYEGEVKQDEKTGGYWVDGALVSQSEIKSIEKKELPVTQEFEKEKKHPWFEGILSSLPFFNKNKAVKDKAHLDVAVEGNTSGRAYVSSYSKPTPATSSQVGTTNYSGTSQNVWQSLRRETNPNKVGGRYNNAGYITKSERIRDVQTMKRNSAAYDLRAERQKNKTAYGFSRLNSAGYELSRQRAVTERELSGFGGSSQRY